MEIGKLIKERRRELGLTLEEIGNAVGVGKSTVKKWEDGYISNMRRDRISALAKVLKLNPVSLVTGEQLPTESNTKPNFAPLPNDETMFVISEHEKDVIIAYRNKPDMQSAFDTLLGVKKNTGCEIATDMVNVIKKGEYLISRICTDIK